MTLNLVPMFLKAIFVNGEFWFGSRQNVNSNFHVLNMPISPVSYRVNILCATPKLFLVTLHACFGEIDGIYITF